MEVTKYYCELCGREVGYREWTEIVIAVRSYVPHMQDVVTNSKKICADCLIEVGLIEGDKKEPSKYVLFDKNIFKNIIKQIVGKKGD